MMAIIHKAQLVPSKIALLAAWVPARPWSGGVDGSGLAAAGAYRFDDPDGEVGIEIHLLTTDDGRTLQVPTTYRAEPLDDADAALIGTLQHSVLGERWVYDGCTDPLFAAMLAAAILGGGTEAALDWAPGTDAEPRPVTTRVRGSGSPAAPVSVGGSITAVDDATTTVIECADLTLTVLRVVDSVPAPTDHGLQTLVGTWPGRDEPTVLATARRT
jgi:hypothetical protein